MAIERWRPGRGLPDPWRHGAGSFFDYAWERFFRPFWETGPGGAVQPYGVVEPAIDVFETDEHMVVKAELPGLDPAAVKVTATEDSIGFRGELAEDEEFRHEGYHWRERRHGLVQRLIPLARRIDPETARASYRNGVLTVRALKVGGERGRTVEVAVEDDRAGYGARPEEKPPEGRRH